MKTLAKLLKEKNTIITKINDVKRRIESENIVQNNNVSKWDVRKQYADLLELTNKLIEIKTDIARLNSSVADKIFRLSELKAIVSFLKDVDTFEGRSFVKNRFDGTSQEEIRSAQMDSIFVQKEIDSLTGQINDLQDELDTYNHTVKI